MAGAVLIYRDDGERPHCRIALGNGERVELALDAAGLTVSRLGPPGPAIELLFRAPPEIVSKLCAGLIGRKRSSDASPLRILTAAIRQVDSAKSVGTVLADATENLG